MQEKTNARNSHNGVGESHELKSISVRDSLTRREISETCRTISFIKEEIRNCKNDFRLSELQSEYKALVKDQQCLENKLRLIRDDKKRLKKREEVIVSEHALLRYCERVLGIDLEEIKHKLLPESTIDQIKTLKSGIFPSKDLKLVVKNKIVVTITTHQP